MYTKMNEIVFKTLVKALSYVQKIKCTVFTLKLEGDYRAPSDDTRKFCNHNKYIFRLMFIMKHIKIIKNVKFKLW